MTIGSDANRSFARAHLPRLRANALPSCPGSLAWIVRHEIRLAMRDWVSPGTGLRVAIVTGGIALVLHLLAYALVKTLPLGTAPNVNTQTYSGSGTGVYLIVSVGLASLFTMMIAQAMEAVTRAFYVRGDLELILSSPVSPRRVFAVRMVAITLTTLSLVGLLILPFVNMMAWIHGWRWLGTYGVLLAMAALAQTLALGIAVGLFRWIGPRRTRVVAQVVGAVLGATAVIGCQVPAILRSGSLSRMELLSDPAVAATLPDATSFVWWPAMAVVGDPLALAVLMTGSIAILAFAIVLISNGFSEMVVAAAGITEAKLGTGGQTRFARVNPPGKAMRQKELRLILRDPWLVSQSLMQILYLIPPALLLWRNFGEASGTLAVLVPVIVMASGQLAGGLAWLAISAEDAPDLIATAPLSPGLAMRAKVEAVALAVGLVSGPFLVALAFTAPCVAAVGLVFSCLAIGSATLIQFRFRSHARRSQFRRRQRSSRLATLAETFVAIAWAAAAGMTAAGNIFALSCGLVAVAIILMCLRGWRNGDGKS